VAEGSAALSTNGDSVNPSHIEENRFVDKAVNQNHTNKTLLPN
jgi:hypothetical protein